MNNTEHAASARAKDPEPAQAASPQSTAIEYLLNAAKQALEHAEAACRAVLDEVGGLEKLDAQIKSITKAEHQRLRSLLLLALPKPAPIKSIPDFLAKIHAIPCGGSDSYRDSLVSKVVQLALDGGLSRAAISACEVSAEFTKRIGNALGKIQ